MCTSTSILMKIFHLNHLFFRPLVEMRDHPPLTGAIWAVSNQTLNDWTRKTLVGTLKKWSPDPLPGNALLRMQRALSQTVQTKTGTWPMRLKADRKRRRSLQNVHVREEKDRTFFGAKNYDFFHVFSSIFNASSALVPVLHLLVLSISFSGTNKRFKDEPRDSLFQVLISRCPYGRSGRPVAAESSRRSEKPGFRIPRFILHLRFETHDRKPSN